ncbi:hypothetical protein GCM10010269_22260 [Streptomyces humidus]|uniref:Uncharacterized protein n=1 Tax=Streptomyces humidus TaxID=52259 RepID=A0A918FTU4_9ACTN|nr:hypothetical protein GCM10010269_22260 [Streptomyces humidus]
MRIGSGDDYLQRLVMYVAFLLDARSATHVEMGPAPRHLALLWRGPSSALTALVYDEF